MPRVTTPLYSWCFYTEAQRDTPLLFFFCLLADEKPGADNGGRKENRKGVPKKKVQGNAYITVDQEEMQEEKEADRGSASSKPNCSSREYWEGG